MALLQIRETQMRALREISTIHSIEGGLQRLFPEECQNLGAIGLQRLAENSIDQARALGFDPPQYLGFAALQMVFGEGFWEQQEYAWAKEILEDRFLWTSAHRMQELRQASVFYLARIAEQEPVLIAATEEAAEEEANQP